MKCTLKVVLHLDLKPGCTPVQRENLFAKLKAEAIGNKEVRGIVFQQVQYTGEDEYSD